MNCFIDCVINRTKSLKVLYLWRIYRSVKYQQRKLTNLIVLNCSPKYKI